MGPCLAIVPFSALPSVSGSGRGVGRLRDAYHTWRGRRPRFETVHATVEAAGGVEVSTRQHGIDALRLVALSGASCSPVAVALPDERTAVQSIAGEEGRVNVFAVQRGLAALVGEVHAPILRIAWRYQVVRTLFNAEVILHGRLVVDALDDTEASTAEGIVRCSVGDATGVLNVNVASRVLNVLHRVERAGVCSVQSSRHAVRRYARRTSLGVNVAWALA